MNKLDNKGWGLGIFFVFISVFFIAILLVAYIANKNGMGSKYNMFDNEDNPLIQIYSEYETIVKDSAMIYQEVNYPDIVDGDVFYVNINRLKLNSQIVKECNGYVEFGKSNGNFYYNPYLKCGNYITNGYVDGLVN